MKVHWNILYINNMKSLKIIWKKKACLSFAHKTVAVDFDIRDDHRLFTLTKFFIIWEGKNYLLSYKIRRVIRVIRKT